MRDPLIEIYLVDSVIKLFNNQALQIISERPQNCTFEVQLAFNIAENLIYNCLFYKVFLFHNANVNVNVNVAIERTNIHVLFT